MLESSVKVMAKAVVVVNHYLSIQKAFKQKDKSM